MASPDLKPHNPGQNRKRQIVRLNLKLAYLEGPLEILENKD